jgi:hypothetical protein
MKVIVYSRSNVEAWTKDYFKSYNHTFQIIAEKYYVIEKYIVDLIEK